jgi:ATP-dependent Clp protease ATP-binding subunit ClpB
VPEEVDEWDRRVRQLEIEREALKREGDERKIKAINEQIANAQERRDSLTAGWQNERDIIEIIQEIKKDIERLELQAEKAERGSDYELVAKIRYGDLQDAQTRLKIAEEKLDQIPQDIRMTSGEVTADDIAEIVSRATGIPVSKMKTTEKERLLRLESEIGQRLIGQEAAVRAVSNAVRRSRAGLQDEDRPLGSFIFLGPTGVGKTELAKTLAEVLFDDEKAITRIDMSEFQEAHMVNRLIGSPLGYIDSEQGGQLTEAVRRRPYSIVLLDEIEKAHPDTFNILLQVLDDGILTDGRGNTANFKNTIIIMTSNTGSEIILENFEDLDALGEEKRAEIIEATKDEVFDKLKESLRPEFLNRIDEQIMFLPLSKDEINQISKLLLKKVEKLLGKQGIVFRMSDRAMEHLSKEGYDPQFGARPMKRVIQRQIIDELSKLVLSGTFTHGDTIYVEEKRGELTFSKEPFAGAVSLPEATENGNGKPTEPVKTEAEEATAKRLKQIKELEKATKDVLNAVKDSEDAGAFD